MYTEKENVVEKPKIFNEIKLHCNALLLRRIRVLNNDDHDITKYNKNKNTGSLFGSV